MNNIGNYNNFIHFRADTPHFRGTTPTNGNIALTNSEMINNYLQACALYNSPFLNTKNIVKREPSEVQGHQNYYESDIHGNPVNSIIYTKNGNGVQEDITINSPDGSTMKRVAVEDGNKKSTAIVIKDDKGNVLVNNNKSYEKLNDNQAVTIVNGERYDITGLNDRVMKITHNGEETVIDFDKFIEKNPYLYESEETGEYHQTQDTLTKEEQNQVENKIRNLPGDDLVRLSQSIEGVALIKPKEGVRGADSFYDDKTGKKKLILAGDDSTDMAIIIHELGHAYNHIDSKNDSDGKLKSNNEHFHNIKDYESKNIAKKYNKDDLSDLCAYQKFADVDSCAQYTKTRQEAEEHLRDETFAETYSILNNPNMLDIDNARMGLRFFGAMKYFPKTIAQTNNTF